MDQQNTKVKVPFSVKWGQIKQLLGSRMMIGVYIGQYCINALTYFYYLVPGLSGAGTRDVDSEAGFVASVPAVCGFIGGVLGGIISDWLMRRTGSLNIARKTPIVMGMLLSMVMVFCNYVNVEWMIIGFMALAFFGKGIGALGWAVMADTAPKRLAVFPVACSTCSVTFLASSRQSQLVISLARLAPLMGADLCWCSCLNRGTELPGAGGRYQAYRAETCRGAIR